MRGHKVQEKFAPLIVIRHPQAQRGLRGPKLRHWPGRGGGGGGGGGSRGREARYQAQAYYTYADIYITSLTLPGDPRYYVHNHKHNRIEIRDH